MISELSPLFHNVATFTKPEDILLCRGSWVSFSGQWPDSYSWARGNTFKVSKTPMLVPYATSRIIPESDYIDIDLSNAAGGLLMYPEMTGVLYQIAVGIKLGNFLIQTYIPPNKYVYALGDSTMWPDVTSATLRYLGAKTYKDSPDTAPLWFLYAIKDMPAFVLRLYALAGIDFEKVTIEWQVNKCQLQLIEQPTPEMLDKSLLLPWYTEFSAI